MSSFQRAYELVYTADDGSRIKLLQTADKPGLMLDFSVNKSSSKEANEASIGITNASPDTIAVFQKPGTIELKVGYHENPNQQPDWAQILVGTRETVAYSDDGGTKRIELRIAEGTTKFQDLQISRTYGVGATTQDIVDDLVAHLIANVPSINDSNRYQLEVLDSYQREQVVFGNAYEKLDQILAGIKYQYWVNNGTITIIKENGFLRAEEVLLNKNNGMIGSPRKIVENDQNSNSRPGIEVQSIINYNFQIGRRLRLQSKDFDNKVFTIDSVTFTGNSFEGEWVSNLKAYEL